MAPEHGPTPGEWIASRFDPDSPWIVVSVAGEWVCKVSSDSRWAGQTPEREEANARHIADLHNTHAALVAERDALRALLGEAVEAIALFHGPAGWSEYEQSPEMKRFRTALQGARP